MERAREPTADGGAWLADGMPSDAMRSEPGTVYWITGLAGAGKTTVGRALAERLRARGRRVAFLDGNELREALFPDAGFQASDRLELARRYSRLCGLLAAQGIDVVCATISLLPEIWERNRHAFASYREVHLCAPMPVLAGRRAELYGDSGRGAREHVVGRDGPAPEPPAPHARLDNDGSRTPDALVDELLARLERADSGDGGGL